MDKYKQSYIKIVNEKIKDNNSLAGLYIRAKDMNMAKEQEKQLIKYCKENEIENKILYIDIGFSGIDNNRPSLNKLKEDIEKKKISKVITINIARLYRDIANLLEFEEKCNNFKIQLIFTDKSLEYGNKLNTIFIKNPDDIEKSEIDDKDYL